MRMRRPTRIRTVPQPPRRPVPRPPVAPIIGRPTASPERRLDNLGQRFLKTNQITKPSQIPQVRTGNVRNIYRPNPNISKLV